MTSDEEEQQQQQQHQQHQHRQLGELTASQPCSPPHRWLPILAALAAFRVWNGLVVVTYFNPDEYWQSVEVAHRWVFGYGHLTWEWRADARLRGAAHPALGGTRPHREDP